MGINKVVLKISLLSLCYERQRIIKKNVCRGTYEYS